MGRGCRREVCPLHDVPIIIFVNKLAREGSDLFDRFIVMLMILKLPHSHAMFPGYCGFQTEGHGRERASLERL
jgi:peptide subunit release factor RF-3